IRSFPYPRSLPIVHGGLCYDPCSIATLGNDSVEDLSHCRVPHIKRSGTKGGLSRVIIACESLDARIQINCTRLRIAWHHRKEQERPLEGRHGIRSATALG